MKNNSNSKEQNANPIKQSPNRLTKLTKAFFRSFFLAAPVLFFCISFFIFLTNDSTKDLENRQSIFHQDKDLLFVRNNAPLKADLNLKYSSNTNTAPSVFSALNWMFGFWEINTGETILKINIFPSDKGGNYLIGRLERFLPNGAATGSALLIIAWNPVSELYETWEFRSDGSFGGGIMEQFGPQWTAPMKYTLFNGQFMTEVITYTPKKSGGFIWQADSRTLSDLPLPSLGPVNAQPLAKTADESFFK